MHLSISPRRLAGVAALACAAALTSATALAATGSPAVPAAASTPGSAGTAGAAASPACRTHPVIAYVVNQMSGTVTPIRTATNMAGKAINVQKYPDAIAITPNGKTAYVASALLGTVTPIRTAAGSVGKPVKVGGPRCLCRERSRPVQLVRLRAHAQTPISRLDDRTG